MLLLLLCKYDLSSSSLLHTASGNPTIFLNILAVSRTKTSIVIISIHYCKIDTLSSSSSCSLPQDSHVNESQSISLDEAISLLSPLPARKSGTSDLWNRIPPFSSIKVVVDTSQIKHTDDGSNDNIFWQIFDELQGPSQDKKIVNGHKLKARLVSTNKYFVSDAVFVIERMERTTKIKSVGFDEYQKRL